MFRILMIVVPLLLLACILPFFIRGKDGQPLLSRARFQAPKIAVPDLNAARDLLDDAQEKVRASLPTPASQPVPMYKWRDGKGGIHLSDRPNPNGPCEVVVVNPEANLVPAVKSRGAAVPTAANGKPATGGLSLTTVPLEQVPKLIDGAREVGTISDQREKTLASQGGH